MSQRAALRRDLAEVRDELAVLTAKVESLSLRVEAESEFEVVAENTPSAGYPESSVGSHNDSVREEAARETGRFFVRCLEGRPRGESGRSRVKLQNRIYVVVKTFSGTVHTKPVILLEKYSQVKKLVCHPDADSFGDAIFSGFPSRWEAQLAVATAGFS